MLKSDPLAIARGHPELLELRQHELPFQPNVAAMAEVAALLGDPARMSMLCCLAQGRPLAARELAARAGVTPQTASGHIAKLVAARLVLVERRGRERFHHLAGGGVTELLSVVHRFGLRARPRGVENDAAPGALRTARVCFDHLGGRLATSWADTLVPAAPGANGTLSQHAVDRLRSWGVSPEPGSGPGACCRLCEDWTEAKPHIGGQLGASMFTRTLELGWIRRLPETRALILTHAGRDGFRQVFGLTFR